MNNLDTTKLDKHQLAHLEAFDERTKPRKVDFDYYNRPNFGPWNPYWFLHNQVVTRCTKQGQKLLCIGCGDGRDALLFARAGYEVFGVDISSRAIEIATDLAAHHGMSDQVHFSQQPAEAMDFEADYFDGAVGVNVLHHVEVARCAAELKRVIKPGGFGIFKEPLLTPVRDKLRNTALVRRLIPKGVKNLRQGVWYNELVPGEKNLDHNDFATIRQQFGNLMVHRWHVIAKASIVVGRIDRLQRWDWRLFSFLPFLRRFGDQAVLIFEKLAEDGSNLDRRSKHGNSD